MSLTLRSVVGQFLKWAACTLAPNTVAAYKHQLEKIPRTVGKKLIARLRPVDLSTWAKTWHEAQAVVRVLNWARDEARLVRSNPLAACRLPGRGQRKRIVSQSLLLRMMRSGRHESRHFLLALRETLARPQEIRAATWEQLVGEDVDDFLDDSLRDGTALIVQREFKDRRRRHDGSRPRVLLVTPRLGRLILRLGRERQKRTGPIFLNCHGRAWTKNAVRCLLRRIRRRLGLARDANGENVVAYTFRHSLATVAASRGIQGRLLADWLGHVETRTTDRYVHLNVGHLRAAIRRIAPDRITMRQDAKRKL